jgi:hypothetical protein
MAQTNASRRLSRILRDEDYGPKLVRLSRADQRRILDLIDANRGAQARREILRLDAERIARQRVRRRALQYAALPEDERRGDNRPDETREFWSAYDAITGPLAHRTRAA